MVERGSGDARCDRGQEQIITSWHRFHGTITGSLDRTFLKINVSLEQVPISYRNLGDRRQDRSRCVRSTAF